MYEEVDEYATATMISSLGYVQYERETGTKAMVYSMLVSYSMIILWSSYLFSFAVADFLGEKLAWFFGITTPKYQYIIDEYHRIKEEVSDSCYCQDL